MGRPGHRALLRAPTGVAIHPTAPPDQVERATERSLPAREVRSGPRLAPSPATAPRGASDSGAAAQGRGGGAGSAAENPRPERCRRLRGRRQRRDDRGKGREVAGREGDELLVRGIVPLWGRGGLVRFSIRTRCRRGIRIGSGAGRDRLARLGGRLVRDGGSRGGNRMRARLPGQFAEVGEEGADLGAEEVPASRACCRALVRHDGSTYPQRGQI